VHGAEVTPGRRKVAMVKLRAKELRREGTFENINGFQWQSLHLGYGYGFK